MTAPQGDGGAVASEARPVRLRLSRAKGFDLQELSQATNGLRCIVVARPGFWGNPFTVTEKLAPGTSCGGSHLYGYFAVPTVEDAVACFREMVTLPAEPGQRAHELRARLHELRGHNLACWCAIDAPCHADVLLELANAPVNAARVQVRDPITGDHHVLDTDTGRTVETRRDGPALGVPVLEPKGRGGRDGT